MPHINEILKVDHLGPNTQVHLTSCCEALGGKITTIQFAITGTLPDELYDAVIEGDPSNPYVRNILKYEVNHFVNGADVDLREVRRFLMSSQLAS